MEQERQIQEELLQAWMGMVTYIRGNRLLSSLSVNEMLICNILYQQRLSGGPPVTATMLCERTQLLKSQMNHILNSMEQRMLIERTPDRSDRRLVSIRLREEAIPTYRQEHEKVLKIVNAVCTSLGQESAHTLAALMRQATAAVNSAISKEEP